MTERSGVPLIVVVAASQNTMGYYLETGANHEKAEWLVRTYGAEEIPTPKWPSDGRVLVFVVDNGPFEAAAIAYNVREMNRFVSQRGGRSVRYLLVPRAKVLENCPHVPLEK